MLFILWCTDIVLRVQQKLYQNMCKCTSISPSAASHATVEKECRALSMHFTGLPSASYIAPLSHPAQWWAAVSPLYPTNFILPIISPTVKNPNTSANMTPPETNWTLLIFRICSSRPVGVAVLEFAAELNAARGFPDWTPLTTLWKYVWNVETGLWADCQLEFHTRGIFSNLRGRHLLTVDN